jgi:tyrosinase
MVDPGISTQPLPPLRQRLNVNKLTPDQLATFREAFRRILSIQTFIDERGYNYLAGMHGLPLQYCRHEPKWWLFWHRAYLYKFELALRDQVPDATLPWWDWTSPSSHESGIPAAYAEEQVDGEDNPLFSVRIPPVARPEEIPKWLNVPQGWDNQTFRVPMSPELLPNWEKPVDFPGFSTPVPPVKEILDYSDWTTFSTQLLIIHGSVHVWMGGTMGTVPWAAFDPGFWAHHAMLDRIWRLWQQRHPNANLSLSTQELRRPMQGTPLNVEQTLDVRMLGYDYASFTEDLPGGS